MTPPLGDPRLMSIDEVLGTLPDTPVSTSRTRTWAGLTIDIFAQHAGYALRTPARDHHLLCYCPAGGGRLVQSRDGVVHKGVISAGMALIMPSGYDAAWDGDAPASARLRIPVSLIEAAAEQIGGRSIARFEIRNVFETRDLLIERIALSLMAEIDRRPHPTQRLISEAMSHALAGHLLRSYNAFEISEAYQAALLGSAELARIVAYIEDNLDRPIGLADLAAVVNVSRFHFARLFKRSTGTTAIRFVEQCRIRKAQSLIERTDLPLAQIALTAGFSDQSHFTRRFHRHIGCTPAAYARTRGRRRTPRGSA